MVARCKKALRLIEEAANEPGKFEGKENNEIEVFLGSFSLKRSALDYVHQLSLPSFWFHHTMVYSILRAHGIPLTKQLYLSAW
ncbi:MAG: hypothetical protein FE78DRAFT_385758 [Acidomyces sp. 'richmondensis']|nr:MAG: hypothetical protein FE78DRAFT_385758 [Acidomyces sp. 'richmondensis']